MQELIGETITIRDGEAVIVESDAAYSHQPISHQHNMTRLCKLGRLLLIGARHTEGFPGFQIGTTSILDLELRRVGIEKGPGPKAEKLLDRD